MSSNQPENGFKMKMILDALKEIPSSFQTEESLDHEIKQLYCCIKKDAKCQEDLRQIMIDNPNFVEKFCLLHSFNINVVVSFEDGTFIQRCGGCCGNLCSETIIVETRSTNSGACRLCTQTARSTRRLDESRVNNW